jgi:hypothetical protein
MEISVLKILIVLKIMNIPNKTVFGISIDYGIDIK